MSYRERQQNTIRLPSDLRYISLAKFSLAVDPLSSSNLKHKSANSYRVMILTDGTNLITWQKLC